jgi:hypothetical protein
MIDSSSTKVSRSPKNYLNNERSYSVLPVRFVVFLIGLALGATLRAASPTPPENPPITPAPARQHSLKEPVSVERLGDSVAFRPRGFEVVPGKDPNGWSFIVEPYLWGLGIDGTVGVKGLDTHVDYNPLTVVKHLDWGIMAEAEVRKGKWGILGDGFFAQLSASGDPPGPLYNNANIKLQQGMVELALAYRIIDDRRGFLDIYAGARYNYFGIDVSADIDEAGIERVSADVVELTSSRVNARVQSAADAEVQRLSVELSAARAGLQQDVSALESLLREDVRARLAGSLEADLQRRLRQDLVGNRAVRDSVRDFGVLRITRRTQGELRSLIDAVVEARLAESRAGIDPRLAQARARAQARVAQAKNRLSKALSEEIEDRLPTSASGDRWWVDPIVGLRTQINFTRWLFLALQGDVGGFGAGSQIAWFASGSIGFNLTRNIFAEMGYRYFFMDYDKNGLTYDAAQSGLFMGIGLKL